MMRVAHELRTAQQLNMTPQLRHAIGLLQLSTMELEQRLREALDSNVFLEADDSGNPDRLALELSGGQRPGADMSAPEIPLPEADLREKLMQQLDLLTLTDRDHLLACLIVDSLDDNGYLTTPPEQLAVAIPGLDADRAEFEAVRQMLQNLDPVGCASIDLGDCLRAQLRRFRGRSEVCPMLLSDVERMSRLDPSAWLTATDQLAASLGCTHERTIRALEFIRKLDPYPGRRVTAGGQSMVIPDVVVRRREGRWVVGLNDRTLPSLRINQACAAMMDSRQCEGHSAMQGQLQEAQWLVKSVHMRNQTLLKVAGAIISRQQQFLEQGEIAMRPMVLGDVAQAIGMHESTVSRVTTNKFMDTPRGLFELKFFFSSRLSTRGGGRCSSTAVRALMRSLVEAENPLQPLSDGAIARLMGQQGVSIARRTVAKYRESLGIPTFEHRVASVSRDLQTAPMAVSQLRVAG